MAKEIALVIAIIIFAVGGMGIFLYFMESSEDGEIGCPRHVPEYSTTQETSREIIDYINSLRNEGGTPAMEFNSHLYLLAEKRVDDMISYGYYAYTNPYTERCVDDLKSSMGFGAGHNVRESINGVPGMDYNSPCLEWVREDWRDVVETWMNSSSARGNLLYAAHTGGAVACKFDKCVFLGLNSRGYETKCY